MPSPILSTKKAAEARLATLSIPTAYENAEFKPTAGQKYLSVQFDIRTPDDPVIGDVYYRERISFQVFVCDLLNKGTASAITTAEQIRDLFKKGTSLTQDGYSIYVLETPRISGSVKTNDRLIVPVLIDLVVDVFLN